MCWNLWEYWWIFYWNLVNPLGFNAWWVIPKKCVSYIPNHRQPCFQSSYSKEDHKINNCQLSVVPLGLNTKTATEPLLYPKQPWSVVNIGTYWFLITTVNRSLNFTLTVSWCANHYPLSWDIHHSCQTSLDNGYPTKPRTGESTAGVGPRVAYWPTSQSTWWWLIHMAVFQNRCTASFHVIDEPLIVNSKPSG